MDTKLLTSFIAVAEEGQVARAAARLHLTQPPLSRHIKMLEDELGVALFRRLAHGMALTEAGRALYEDARHIQALVRDAVHRVRDVQSGLAGTLNIGVYGSSTFGALTALLAKFHAAHSAVALHLHDGPLQDQISYLKRGQTDIYFDRNLSGADEFQAVEIVRENLFVAISANHRLAKYGGIFLSDLKTEKIIIGSDLIAVAQLVAHCQAAGFEPNLSKPNANIVMASMLAAIGVGVTIVPASMTRVAFPGIVYRELCGMPEGMPLYAFFQKDNDNPALQRLLTHLLADTGTEASALASR